MHSSIAAALAALRRARGFSAAGYVEAKIALVNEYLTRAGLRGCVVGVSGGVDSAVTLALLAAARRRRGSPIERLVAALLPLHTEGATNQDRATERGREIAEQFDAEIAAVDLSSGFAEVRASVEAGLGRRGDAWAAGQLVSYLRTPALYYATALLAEVGVPSLLVGTTNRDEGAYLGFFGKASDGMVDLQLISDLHKSEVYAVAELLGVPQSVRAAAPTGDTFDGRTDEEMIGLPYDWVELHAQLRCLPAAARDAIVNQLDHGARAELASATATLEARHAANAHKYVGDSPAIHLDVHPRAVPGGWRGTPDDRVPAAVDHGRFVGELALPSEVRAALLAECSTPRSHTLGDFGPAVSEINGLLSRAVAGELAGVLAAAATIATGRDGRVGTPGDGSRRAAFFDPEIAAALWARLAPLLPPLRVVDEHSAADADAHPVWRAVGVSPLFRALVYDRGGEIVAHYDAAYDDGAGRRTLQSVVVFLTDASDEDGGVLRLLVEPQRHRPRRDREFADRATTARDDEVLAAVRPVAGNAVIFDHRIPHDATAWCGSASRIVLRTDLVYERVAERALPPRRAPSAPPPKLDGDPYYTAVWRRDPSRLDEAGWFDDGAASRADFEPRWLTTPLHKIISRLGALPTDATPTVLVSTGAFCPIHRGHLHMMEEARRALEARGHYVLGGFLSPSHDQYVLQKCGDAVPRAGHRIRLAEQAVAASDWLAVDPWEALDCDRAVNFTDVVAHLDAYLARHVRLHRRVEVAYVFGADNARFALAFAERGAAVCIARPGCDASFTAYARHPWVRGREHLVFAPASDAASSSSTVVRGGDDSTLPAPVRRVWRRWQATPAEITTMTLGLRDEGDWAVARWLADRPTISAAYGRFVDGVIATLRHATTRAVAPDPDASLTVVRVALADQRRDVARRVADRQVISLDPCIPATHNLGVSRAFSMSGGEPLGFVARPGWPPLAEQIAQLPDGSYVLVDDDICTGRTIAWISAQLPPRVHVAQTLAACDLKGLGAHDLVDGRDFLFGAHDAGLVCELPTGELVRAPYLAPYVRPAERVGVPLSIERALSHAIWDLNCALYESVTPPLTVADADPAVARLCRYLDFAPTTTLAEVCRWHCDRLATR